MFGNEQDRLNQLRREIESQARFRGVNVSIQISRTTGGGRDDAYALSVWDPSKGSLEASKQSGSFFESEIRLGPADSIIRSSNLGGNIYSGELLPIGKFGFDSAAEPVLSGVQQFAKRIGISFGEQHGTDPTQYGAKTVQQRFQDIELYGHPREQLSPNVRYIGPQTSPGMLARLAHTRVAYITPEAQDPRFRDQAITTAESQTMNELWRTIYGGTFIKDEKNTPIFYTRQAIGTITDQNELDTFMGGQVYKNKPYMQLRDQGVIGYTTRQGGREVFMPRPVGEIGSAEPVRKSGIVLNQDYTPGTGMQLDVIMPMFGVPGVSGTALFNAPSALNKPKESLAVAFQSWRGQTIKGIRSPESLVRTVKSVDPTGAEVTREELNFSFNNEMLNVVQAGSRGVRIGTLAGQSIEVPAGDRPYAISGFHAWLPMEWQDPRQGQEGKFRPEYNRYAKLFEQAGVSYAFRTQSGEVELGGTVFQIDDWSFKEGMKVGPESYAGRPINIYERTGQGKFVARGGQRPANLLTETKSMPSFMLNVLGAMNQQQMGSFLQYVYPERQINTEELFRSARTREGAINLQQLSTGMGLRSPQHLLQDVAVRAFGMRPDEKDIVPMGFEEIVPGTKQTVRERQLEQYRLFGVGRMEEGWIPFGQQAAYTLAGSSIQLPKGKVTLTQKSAFEEEAIQTVMTSMRASGSELPDDELRTLAHQKVSQSFAFELTRYNKAGKRDPKGEVSLYTGYVRDQALRARTLQSAVTEFSGGANEIGYDLAQAVYGISPELAGWYGIGIAGTDPGSQKYGVQIPEKADIQTTDPARRALLSIRATRLLNRAEMGGAGTPNALVMAEEGGIIKPSEMRGMLDKYQREYPDDPMTVNKLMDRYVRKQLARGGFSEEMAEAPIYAMQSQTFIPSFWAVSKTEPEGFEVDESNNVIKSTLSRTTGIHNRLMYNLAVTEQQPDALSAAAGVRSDIENKLLQKFSAPDSLNSPRMQVSASGRYAVSGMVPQGHLFLSKSEVDRLSSVAGLTRRKEVLAYAGALAGSPVVMARDPIPGVGSSRAAGSVLLGRTMTGYSRGLGSVIQRSLEERGLRNLGIIIPQGNLTMQGDADRDPLRYLPTVVPYRGSKGQLRFAKFKPGQNASEQQVEEWSSWFNQQLARSGPEAQRRGFEYQIGLAQNFDYDPLRKSLIRSVQKQMSLFEKTTKLNYRDLQAEGALWRMSYEQERGSAYNTYKRYANAVGTSLGLSEDQIAAMEDSNLIHFQRSVDLETAITPLVKMLQTAGFYTREGERNPRFGYIGTTEKGGKFTALWNPTQPDPIGRSAMLENVTSAFLETKHVSSEGLSYWLTNVPRPWTQEELQAQRGKPEQELQTWMAERHIANRELFETRRRDVQRRIEEIRERSSRDEPITANIQDMVKQGLVGFRSPIISAMFTTGMTRGENKYNREQFIANFGGRPIQLGSGESITAAQLWQETEPSRMGFDFLRGGSGVDTATGLPRPAIYEDLPRLENFFSQMGEAGLGKSLLAQSMWRAIGENVGLMNPDQILGRSITIGGKPITMDSWMGSIGRMDVMRATIAQIKQQRIQNYFNPQTTKGVYDIQSSSIGALSSGKDPYRNILGSVWHYASRHPELNLPDFMMSGTSPARLNEFGVFQEKKSFAGAGDEAEKSVARAIASGKDPYDLGIHFGQPPSQSSIPHYSLQTPIGEARIAAIPDFLSAKKVSYQDDSGQTKERWEYTISDWKNLRRTSNYSAEEFNQWMAGNEQYQTQLLSYVQMFKSGQAPEWITQRIEQKYGKGAVAGLTDPTSTYSTRVVSSSAQTRNEGKGVGDIYANANPAANPRSSGIRSWTMSPEEVRQNLPFLPDKVMSGFGQVLTKTPQALNYLIGVTNRFLGINEAPERQEEIEQATQYMMKSEEFGEFDWGGFTIPKNTSRRRVEQTRDVLTGLLNIATGRSGTPNVPTGGSGGNPPPPDDPNVPIDFPEPEDDGQGNQPGGGNFGNLNQNQFISTLMQNLSVLINNHGFGEVPALLAQMAESLNRTVPKRNATAVVSDYSMMKSRLAGYFGKKRGPNSYVGGSARRAFKNMPKQLSGLLTGFPGSEKVAKKIAGLSPIEAMQEFQTYAIENEIDISTLLQTRAPQLNNILANIPGLMAQAGKLSHEADLSALLPGDEGLGILYALGKPENVAEGSIEDEIRTQALAFQEFATGLKLRPRNTWRGRSPAGVNPRVFAQQSQRMADAGNALSQARTSKRQLGLSPASDINRINVDYEEAMAEIENKRANLEAAATELQANIAVALEPSELPSRRRNPRTKAKAAREAAIKLRGNPMYAQQAAALATTYAELEALENTPQLIERERQIEALQYGPERGVQTLAYATSALEASNLSARGAGLFRRLGPATGIMADRIGVELQRLGIQSQATRLTGEASSLERKIIDQIAEARKSGLLGLNENPQSVTDIQAIIGNLVGRGISEVKPLESLMALMGERETVRTRSAQTAAELQAFERTQRLPANQVSQMRRFFGASDQLIAERAEYAALLDQGQVGTVSEQRKNLALEVTGRRKALEAAKYNLQEAEFAIAGEQGPTFLSNFERQVRAGSITNPAELEKFRALEAAREGVSTASLGVSTAQATLALFEKNQQFITGSRYLQGMGVVSGAAVGMSGLQRRAALEMLRISGLEGYESTEAIRLEKIAGYDRRIQALDLERTARSSEIDIEKARVANLAGAPAGVEDVTNLQQAEDYLKRARATGDQSVIAGAERIFAGFQKRNQIETEAIDVTAQRDMQKKSMELSVEQSQAYQTLGQSIKATTKLLGDYTDAIKKHGKDSEQAQKALHELSLAQVQQTKAQKEVEMAAAIKPYKKEGETEEETIQRLSQTTAPAEDQAAAIILRKKRQELQDIDRAEEELKRERSDQPGGLGKFVRNVFGGFGLMYMRSMAGIMTQSGRMGYQESEEAQSVYNAIMAREFGADIRQSPELRLQRARERYAGYGARSLANLQAEFMEESPGGTGFLGMLTTGGAAAGTTMWLLGQTKMAPKMQVGIGVGLGVAAGLGSVYAGYRSAMLQPDLVASDISSRQIAGTYGKFNWGDFAVQTLGGAASGAGIGSMFNPGVGTGIGAVVGAVSSAASYTLGLRVTDLTDAAGMAYRSSPQIQQTVGVLNALQAAQRSGTDLKEALFEQGITGQTAQNRYLQMYASVQGSLNTQYTSETIAKSLAMEYKYGLTGGTSEDVRRMLQAGYNPEDAARAMLTSSGIGFMNQIARGNETPYGYAPSFMNQAISRISASPYMNTLQGQELFAAGTQYRSSLGLAGVSLAPTDMSALLNQTAQYGAISGTLSGQLYAARTGTWWNEQMFGFGTQKPNIEDYVTPSEDITYRKPRPYSSERARESLLESGWIEQMNDAGEKTGLYYKVFPTREEAQAEKEAGGGSVQGSATGYAVLKNLMTEEEWNEREAVSPTGEWVTEKSWIDSGTSPTEYFEGLLKERKAGSLLERYQQNLAPLLVTGLGYSASAARLQARRFTDVTAAEYGRTEEKAASLMQMQEALIKRGFSGEEAEATAFRYMNQSRITPEFVSFATKALNFDQYSLAFAQANNIQIPGLPNIPQQMITSEIGQFGAMKNVVTGNRVFTTTMQGLGNTPAQNASRIWGVNWQQNQAANLAVNGITLPFNSVINGEPVQVGGMQALQYQNSLMSYQQSMAQAGLQMKQWQLQYAFTTGVGLSAYNNMANPQGGTFGTLFAGGEWGIQDAQRALSNRQQQWGFQMQQEQMDMSTKFFWQNLGLNRQQTVMQRGWTKEDWSYQDQTRNLQWGWRLEDFQEQSRFMTGRDRRLAERQMGRETIMHNLETEQIDKSRNRQKELWKLEDERYRVQKDQFQENLAMQQKQLLKSREFYEEGFRLTEESINLQRAMWTESMELQKQGIGMAVGFAKKQYDNQVAMLALQKAQEEAIAKAQEMQTWMELSSGTGLDLMKQGFDLVIEKVKEIFNIAGVDFEKPSINVPGEISDDPIPMATGGGVEGGSSIVGGEFGPEIYTPGATGYVSPAHMTDSWRKSVITSGKSSSIKSSGQIVLTVNIGNEHLTTVVLDTVDRELNL